MKKLLYLCLPKLLLSLIARKIANSKNKKLKNFLIKSAIKRFKIDLSEARKPDIDSYLTFNDFFTRELLPEARPINQEENSLIAPADNKVSQFGVVTEGKLIQAKGYDYLLSDLLGNELKDYANKFLNGNYLTLYLSPKDYHRVHMPCDGRLLKSVYLPGRLFPVNQWSSTNIANLFATNERLVAVFECGGRPVCLIMVGATMVSGIVTKWSGLIDCASKRNQVWDFQNHILAFKKGDEIGQFQFGSTVIMLLPANSAELDQQVQIGSSFKMGQKIAKFVL